MLNHPRFTYQAFIDFIHTDCLSNSEYFNPSGWKNDKQSRSAFRDMSSDDKHLYFTIDRRLAPFVQKRKEVKKFPRESS